MTFGYYCNLNQKDEDLFSFELIIYVSTVAKGPEITIPREELSEFADERYLFSLPHKMFERRMRMGVR